MRLVSIFATLVLVGLNSLVAQTAPDQRVCKDRSLAALQSDAPEAMPLLGHASSAGSSESTLLSDTGHAAPIVFPPRSPLASSQAEILTPKKSWTGLAIVGSLSLTALLIETDQRSYSALDAWKRSQHFINESSPIITQLGDGKSSLAIFGGFLAYSLVFDDHKSMEVGKIGLESFLLSGFATHVVKQLFSRERPSTATQNGGAFHGPFAFFRQGSGQKRGMAAFDSFPSGHTASVFAAATTIADFYSSPWVSYSAYGLASAVAISRITERTHWTSDVFVGALLGHFATKLVEHLNYRAADVSVAPTADGQQYGVSLSVRM